MDKNVAAREHFQKKFEDMGYTTYMVEETYGSHIIARMFAVKGDMVVCLTGMRHPYEADRAYMSAAHVDEMDKFMVSQTEWLNKYNKDIAPEDRVTEFAGTFDSLNCGNLRILDKTDVDTSKFIVFGEVEEGSILNEAIRYCENAIGGTNKANTYNPIERVGEIWNITAAIQKDEAAQKEPVVAEL